jgi:hypothetical protein
MSLPKVFKERKIMHPAGGLTNIGFFLLMAGLGIAFFSSFIVYIK